MGLQDSVAATFRHIGARVRRDAIGYGLCAICAIAVLILATWASVLALVPAVGAIYAPLLVAGFFILVMVCILLWLQHSHARRPVNSPLPFMQSDATQRQAQFAQIAMIIEAVMLGYTLSRRTNRR